jgi:ABC-type sugar transport system ATPase subunit
MTESTELARPAVLLQVEEVSRRFGAIQAVDRVSFDVRAGEILGLCGHNGAGKSTIVKILSGLLSPDNGRVLLGGKEVIFESATEAQARGVVVVDQELSVVPAISVLDNLFLGNVKESLFQLGGKGRTRARRLLDAVGLKDVNPGDYGEDLSIGQLQLVEIARALGRDASLLVLDEPTATLGSVDIEHVFTAIRQVTAAGCGVIFVSHRLDEVMELCQRVTVMRDGRLVGTAAIKDLTGDDIVAMMIGKPPATSVTKRERKLSADIALSISNLSAGTRTRRVSFEARGGAVYALAGQVGSGTSDVVRAVAGLAPEARGGVYLEGRPIRLGSPTEAREAGIAYISGDRKREGLFLGQPVESNLTATRLRAFSHWGALRMGELRAVAKEICKAIGLAPERLDESVLRLSGGNQQKVLLGRCLHRSDTRVLLLDEPTRGVDVRGRVEIHNLIRGVADTGAVVIFTSTELDEILDLADIVITMRGGVVVSQRDRADVDAHNVLADMTHSDLSESS